MRYLATCLAVWCSLAAPASAVIVNFAGSGASIPPGGDPPGYDNVGIRGSGSAVYLGNGWMLTATHVGAGTTYFDGTPYIMVPGSAVQLPNPRGAGYSPLSDLTLYQIQNPPSLPTLSIDSSLPQVGWQVTMAGYGRDVRSTSEAYWTSTWGTATSPSPYAGYIWSGNSIMRWGTNIIDEVSVPQGIGSFSDQSFVTTFSASGLPNEAQGSPGDSGGAVFHTDPRTGQTFLSGIMFAVSSFPGQPWGISVFGNATYSAELAVYRSEIYSIIGLPGDANHDGVVNGLDVSQIMSNWLQRSTGVNSLPGDVNHDGVVNGLDLSLVYSAWANSSSGSAAVAAASGYTTPTPEPSTLVLGLSGLAGLLWTFLQRKAGRHRSRTAI